MRAVVVKAFGGPEQLHLEQLPDLTPGPGELRIAVRAAALNRADLLQRRGLYPPPKGTTEILGLECAGVVDAVGAGVSEARLGQRVMALLAGGGYAEQVVVSERLAVVIPEGMSFIEAAAIPEAFLTAREALFTLGALEADQRVLIHAAAGGVGSAAVQLARVHGARVVATAGTDEKVALARELGAELAINYRSAPFGAACREALGEVDLILDFIGGSYWEEHARLLAAGGKLVVIGVLGGAKATVHLGQLLARRLQILGLVMRARALADKIAITERFVAESLPRFTTGELKPVIDQVFSLSDVRRAHERMERNENLGKIVLEHS